MSENQKNMHKHSTGPIIFASVLLIIIALTSLIITITALVKDKEPPKEPDTEDIGDNTGDNGENGDGENENGETNKNLSVEVNNGEIYRGPLLQIDGENPYTRPSEELISSSEMEALGSGAVLSTYNFVNVAARSDGNFKTSGRLMYLDENAANAFCEMMKQYVAETGIKCIQLRNAYSETVSPTDPRLAGLSVNLNILDGATYPLKTLYKPYNSSNYYNWFINNCHKYGYIHTGDASFSNGTGYSTFRYVGEPHSTYMKNNNIYSYQDYLALIKTKTPTDRLVTSDASGNEWWIYYVSAKDGDTTSVPVFGSKYKIYGDNVGGFIVSVDTSGIK